MNIPPGMVPFWDSFCAEVGKDRSERFFARERRRLAPRAWGAQCRHLLGWHARLRHRPAMPVACERFRVVYRRQAGACQGVVTP